MRTSSLSGPTGFGLFLTVSTLLGGQTFQEDFASDPAAHGWQWFGDPSLFAWDAANQALEVTWDSSRTNSYFHRPLGTILTRGDDFSLAFDLRLRDIAIGTTPGKDFTFQLALGFLNLRDATRTAFMRGTGMDSPNLVEFDYFPDSGFGATVSPTLISSNMGFASSFNVLALTPDDDFHVTMSYTPSNQTLVTTMAKNREEFGPIRNVVLTNQTFTDFRVDHVAVCSYSDFGQDPAWDGSILAHGTVDNLELTLPDPPVAVITGAERGGHWTASFNSQTNWVYALETAPDFASWQKVSAVTPGTGSLLTLADTNHLGDRAFYRVLAERP
jgi:hypothetical protein